MSHSRSRTKTRSPAIPARLQPRSPHPFLPPSHYAAAAGIPYPVNVNRPSYDIKEAVANGGNSMSSSSALSPSWKNMTTPTGHSGHPSPSEASSFSPNSFNHDAPSARANRLSIQSVRSKRKSQIEGLGMLEAQLLPSLRDTVDRMTRPPSGMFSPSLASGGVDADRTGSANCSSISSCSSLANSSDSRQHSRNSQSTPMNHIHHDPARSVDSTTSSMRVNPPTPKLKPKPILKPHLQSPAFSHTQSRRSGSSSAAIASAGSHDMSLRSRKSGVNATKKPSTQACSISHDRKRDEGTSDGRSSSSSSSVKTPLAANSVEPARRTSRARSRTDPGTVPKHPTLSGHSVVLTPQPNVMSSNIPRRIAYPSTPGPYSSSKKSSMQDNDSEVESRFEVEMRERRKLVITNGIVTPSSSSESNQVERAPDKKSKLPTFSVRQHRLVDEVEKKQSRFGLGFGFADYSTKFKSIFVDAGLRTPDEKNNEPDSSRAGFRSSIADRDEQVQSSTLNMDIDMEQVRTRASLANSEAVETNTKRQEALRGIVDGPDTRSYFEPRPHDTQNEEGNYFGEDGFASGEFVAGLASVDERDLSNDGNESVSEYSSDDDERADANVSEAECGDGTPRGGAIPRFVVSTDSTSECSYEQQVSSYVEHDMHALRANSRSPIIRHGPGVAVPPALKRHSVYQMSGPLSFASDDGDGPPNKMNETDAHRYSSELSRLMAITSAAATRERQAFGIPPSLSGYGADAQGEELTHADSNMSSLDSDFWQEDCNDLTVTAGSLFKQLGDQARAEESSEEYLHSQGGYEPRLSSERNHRYTQSNDLSQSSELSTSHSSCPSYTLSQTSSCRQSVQTESSHSRNSSQDWETWETFRDTLSTKYGEEEMQRQEVIWELTQTETVFVTQMQTMVRIFIRPLRIQRSKMWVSGVPSDVARLFDWLEDIVHLHSQLLSALLDGRNAQTPMLQFMSSSIRPFVPRLEIYQPYLVRLEFVASLIEKFVTDEDSDFGDFVKIQESSSQCNGWTLEKYLVEPVNRLAQYPEFFRRLWKLTPKKHPDYLSAFSVLHSLNLVIRVLSEVKDREDEYEFVKEISSRIQGLQSARLAKRERRLLMHGSLRCTRITTDDRPPITIDSFDSSATVMDITLQATNDKSGRCGELAGRNTKLVNAVKGRRGRSGSVRSTTSTATSLKSFRTASSSFDIQMALPYNYRDKAPSITSFSETRFESIQVFVFTDLILLLSPINRRHSSSRQVQKDEAVNFRLLEGLGISRVFAVCDGTDHHPTITLDLLPLTVQELESGVIEDSPSMMTVSLSPEGGWPSDDTRNDVQGSSSLRRTLRNWLSPLQQSCQSTLKSLSLPSHGRTYLAHGPDPYSEPYDRQPVLSILASGLPLPKSPSAQIHEAMQGHAGDFTQQEREQRGWWSLRFQQVLREIQNRDARLYP